MPEIPKTGGRVSEVPKASRSVDDLALGMLREHFASLVGWPLPPLVRLGGGRGCEG